MTLTFSPHPKVHTLGHRENREVLQGNVVIQEKVDGSQFGILGTHIPEDVRCRSRNQELSPPGGQFAAGLAAVLRESYWFEPGYIYYGEYLSKPTHNRQKYERIPQNHIIMFALRTGEDVRPLACASGDPFESVPFVQVLNPTQEDLQKEMDKPSILGGKREGIVIRNVDNWQIAKLVSEEFKERKSSPSSKPTVEDLLQSFASPARWAKAVANLRDSGELKGEMSDMGKLVPLVRADLLEEAQEEFKDELYVLYQNKFLAAGISGLAEWYKKELANATP